MSVCILMRERCGFGWISERMGNHNQNILYKIFIFNKTIEKNDMFILGGDVYRITENSIEALGDNWYIESVRNIKPKDSIDETMKYINDYYVKNGNQYIYSLVIQS